jgi:hypothetical protein
MHEWWWSYWSSFAILEATQLFYFILRYPVLDLFHIITFHHVNYTLLLKYCWYDAFAIYSGTESWKLRKITARISTQVELVDSTHVVTLKSFGVYGRPFRLHFHHKYVCHLLPATKMNTFMKIYNPPTRFAFVPAPPTMLDLNLWNELSWRWVLKKAAEWFTSKFCC